MDKVEERLRAMGVWEPADEIYSESSDPKSKGLANIDWSITRCSDGGLIYRPETWIPFVENGPEILKGFTAILADVAEYSMNKDSRFLDSIRKKCDLLFSKFGLEEIPDINNSIAKIDGSS